MDGLSNDETVKRITRPIECKCCTDDGSKRQFAGFQSDIAAQAVDDVASGAIDTGDFMQIGQLKFDHRGNEQLSCGLDGIHTLRCQTRRAT